MRKLHLMSLFKVIKINDETVAEGKDVFKVDNT